MALQGELRKNWDDRWFVLTHDKLSYYKSQKAYLQRDQPKAVIPIQVCKSGHLLLPAPCSLLPAPCSLLPAPC